MRKPFSKKKEKEFDQIITEYGEILVKFAGYLLRPESELPANQEKIKESIMLEAILALRLSDFERIETLKYGYGELATFVSDAAFNHYKIFHEMFIKGAREEVEEFVINNNYKFPSEPEESRVLVKEYLLEFNNYIEKIKGKLNDPQRRT